MPISCLSDKGVDLLVESIILQAIADYQYALKFKDKIPRNENTAKIINGAIKQYMEVRRFFQSGWYSMMCSIPGDKILKQIEADFKKGIIHKSNKKIVSM